MPIFEVAIPNSLKDGWSHPCPYPTRNEGTKTSVRALDYGATCKSCGVSNPPLMDNHGKTWGDKTFNPATAKDWHSVSMTGDQLERIWRQYPFAVEDIRIIEGKPPKRPKFVPRPGGAKDIQRQIDEAVVKAVAQALKAAKAIEAAEAKAAEDAALKAAADAEKAKA